MGKYCCFLCPSKDYSEKTLKDICPSCGSAYDFPLLQIPNSIGDYTVIKSQGRGFYAVTYLCQRGPLKTPYILKISPTALYKFFNKNFEEECKLHREVAQDTEHIVPIIDYFDKDIKFGNIKIKCHIAVMEFVDGPSLEEYLADTENLTSQSIAQISIDLFRICDEFFNKLKYHNDLHENNIIIKRLSAGSKRAEALDSTIRAVAIDLGSVADASKSNCAELRFSDQHWLCRHLQRMADKLRSKRKDIDKFNDLDNRIAEALDKVISFLLPSAVAGRIPTADQLMQIVRDYFYRPSMPWTEPLKLVRFDDSYNAGALEPWYVPFLLVDPNDQWIKKISASGPLLITGMRGCGKTMLLRALDFHARAASRDSSETSEMVLKRLHNDRYMGIFVSCLNLLTMPGSAKITAPFDQLFYAYCIEIIRAARHLKELDLDSCVSNYYEHIIETIKINSDLEFDETKIISDSDLERFLLRTIADLKKGKLVSQIKTSPADLFISLANAVRKCSNLWSTSRIFFLLDDVSTRYLKEELIKEIFSALIFQNPSCAFKLTTEVQTLEMGLYSPGQVEKARVGRDYDFFDLGAEVYEKTKDKDLNGKLFIEQILERRANYYPNHPKKTPREILGDNVLQNIAKKIGATSSSSRDRKAIYYGITCLSAVCVGDIGDVISLYELILKKAAGKPSPVDEEVQSECYQFFCSRRLYDLNRRENYLKDFALTFAEASHELLLKSYRQTKTGRTTRIRQYASVYVRVTAGDMSKQFERLRELVDAGVFVLHGGTQRSKTRDSDPIQQFKLTYRKIFGLSNYIGLSERDRFELSGNQLEEWLSHPEKGKEILLRNLGVSEDEAINDEEIASVNDYSLKKVPKQSSFFDTDITVLKDVFRHEEDSTQEICGTIPPRVSIKELSLEDLNVSGIKVVVLGMGFEERSLESAKRLFSVIKPTQVILIKYDEPGEGKKIHSLAKKYTADVKIIKYKDLFREEIDKTRGPTLIDVTALAKPALFYLVRKVLINNQEVSICHTRAEQYYPLDEDIKSVLNADTQQDHYKLLDSLSKIFTGEEGPYYIDSLLESEVDESLRKVLFTFASPKHERLLKLLDARDYDRVEIIVPRKETPRSKIAIIAAEIAAWNFQSTGMIEVPSNDLIGIKDNLLKQYIYWYVDRGYNVEFGLTGSKMQALACAALSVQCKIAHCWYVRPKVFDFDRFTKGVSTSQYYKIT